MMPERDVVTWSAMIVGLGQHGHGREALEHFHRMISEGVKPNHVTYIGVLSACSHGGLVEEGLRYFHSMTKDHGILPEVEHFGCIVDLLGRAGHLEEAENVVNKMPQTPAAVTWAALLSACRLHGNVKMAERAAQYRGRLEPQNAAVYVSLAHVYATAGMWQNATLLRKLMEDRGVTKELECSWIEVEGSTPECVAV
jgi:pentatricopeptide repeat protein